MDYSEFFEKAYGKEADDDFRPYDYQRRIAEGPWPDLAESKI